MLLFLRKLIRKSNFKPENDCHTNNAQETLFEEKRFYRNFN